MRHEYPAGKKCPNSFRRSKKGYCVKTEYVDNLGGSVRKYKRRTRSSRSFDAREIKRSRSKTTPSPSSARKKLFGRRMSHRKSEEFIGSNPLGKTPSPESARKKLFGRRPSSRKSEEFTGQNPIARKRFFGSKSRSASVEALRRFEFGNPMAQIRSKDPKAVCTNQPSSSIPRDRVLEGRARAEFTEALRAYGIAQNKMPEIIKYLHFCNKNNIDTHKSKISESLGISSVVLLGLKNQYNLLMGLNRT